MKININNIQKHFGEKLAVNIPDFTINENTILGLVGNNGAGKTTLFRLMLDLLKADSGNVRIGDFITSETEKWKSYTGAYISSSFLIDYLTPEEYFSFIGKIEKISQADTDAQLEKFKEFMNGEILGQKKLIRNMSEGNKQKIGIISTMLHQPQIVILDEPFNFLDPSSQSILKHILKEYREQHEATIIISSHNINHTTDLCNEVALLENGEIIRHLTSATDNMQKELEEYFNVY